MNDTLEADRAQHGDDQAFMAHHSNQYLRIIDALRDIPAEHRQAACEAAIKEAAKLEAA